MKGPFKHGILALCGMNLILDFTLFCAQTSIHENLARVLLLNYMNAVTEKKCGISEMWPTLSCAQLVVLNLNLANRVASIAFRNTLILIIHTKIRFYTEN